MAIRPKPEQYVEWEEQACLKVILQPVIIEPYHYGFIIMKFSFSLNKKFGIIVENKEFEKAWNAFRFTVTTKNQKPVTKVFLMGEAVECEGLTHEKHNVNEQLKAVVNVGREIFAFGTCLKSC